jgi:hypothetical protein
MASLLPSGSPEAVFQRSVQQPLYQAGKKPLVGFYVKTSDTGESSPC